MSTLAPAARGPMTAEERKQFEEDGYLIIRGALNPDEVAYYTKAIDEAYEAQKKAGNVSPYGSLHKLSAVTSCPALVPLLDHPAVFPLVWSTIGWNIHVYHSHFDVHPTVPPEQPFRWEWHQDGGRQNVELETDPRPRMSVKLAYFLSDVSEKGRGNLKVIPGSHKRNWLPGPPNRNTEWPEPEDAIEVQVSPGDVVFFDRRIWHARSNNYSDITRKVVFMGYTFRWIHIRDEVADLPNQPWWKDLTPIQRQLLGGEGDGTGDHQWGHYPDRVPLYTYLKENDLLDPETNRAHRR